MLAFLNLLMCIALFVWSAYTLCLYYRESEKEKTSGTAAQLWAVCLTSLYVTIHDSVMILFMFQCDFFRLAEPWYRFTGSYEDLQISWFIFFVALIIVFLPIYHRLKASH